MVKDSGMCKIKITKDGPYLVSGNVPIAEKIIVPKGKTYEFIEGRPLPQSEHYSHCRCGHSKNAPFCDGNHLKNGFIGKENASKELYQDRAEFMEGAQVDLMDDGRCAFARFCHRKNGKVWARAEESDIGDNREEVIAAANNCPSGRLTAVDKDGTEDEPDYQPSIDILQDSERRVSSGVFVKGNIKWNRLTAPFMKSGTE